MPRCPVDAVGDVARRLGRGPTPRHFAGAATENKTCSTGPRQIEAGTGASGTPTTNGGQTEPSGGVLAGRMRGTIRRLMEITRVISDNSAVCGLSIGSAPSK